MRRIVGLPPSAAPGGRGFMFPGLHVLEPEVFRWMDAGGVFSITRVTYPRMIAAGLPVFGCVTQARWITIDTPEALATADRVLRDAPFAV